MAGARGRGGRGERRTRGEAAETVSLIEAEGGRAIAVVADCRDDAQVAEMVQRTVADLGGLDIAVNNFGMLAGRGASAFVDTDGAYWATSWART